MGQIVKVYKDGVGYQVLNTNNIGDALEAGDNISINGNEISAVDTTYSAGTGLSLSGTTFSLNINYGADLSLSIDPSTFVLTAQLKDQNGSNIGSAQTIDLPLESVVVSGTYNAQTKEVELTLQSGSVIRFSVADLVSGLQEELVVGEGINIDANNEISVDTSVMATKEYVDDSIAEFVSSGPTAPSNPTQGMLRYDTVNDVLKSYDGSNWNEVGNESADINTKTFHLSGTSDLTNAQAAYDWFSAGKNPIVMYNNRAYLLYAKNATQLIFQDIENSAYNQNSYTEYVGQKIIFTLSGNDVTAINYNSTSGWSGPILRTDVDYSTPYTPTYEGSPATKQYVDNNDTYIGASAPIDNVVEGRLWYDTTNSVLKEYDGTNWNEVNTDTTYTAGTGISIDANNVISNTQTSAEWGNITGTLSDQTDLQNALNEKQDTLTAGNHINITNNTISTTGLQEELIAGENITIGDECTIESDMKGPCPKGFHVPLDTERQTVFDIGVTFGLWSSSSGNNVKTYLKMPFAGEYSHYDGHKMGIRGEAAYWASPAVTMNSNAAKMFMCFDNYMLAQSATNKTAGLPIRPFKNTPETPDSSWTTLYDGSAIATEAGIFHNITDGLISLSSDGVNRITMADKNIGATQVYDGGYTINEANAGWYFQWGNNYAFPFDGGFTISSTPLDASTYGPGNYYYSDVFITSGDNSTWDTSDNKNLRGGVTQGTFQDCIHNVISAIDTTYTAGTGISIDANNVISNTQTSAEWGNITGTLSDQTDLQNALDEKQDTLTAGNHIDITNNVISAEGFQEELTAGENITIGEVCESDMKGPCPSGFHVPLTTEWQAVRDIRVALGGGSSDGTNFGIALKLPFAGYRSNSSAGLKNQGTYGRYWSSTHNGTSSAYSLYFTSTVLNPQNGSYRSYGFSVRCFKNSPTVPTSSWAKLYGTSIEAGGIFWSSTDGLISLSSDGTNWITIADKNLGATTVWNSGDTLSEANAGKYYQRGNNYGFQRASDATITTSSTQVDASNYGPGNYYSSSTFITRSSNPYRWDTTDNGNLWGGVTQGQGCSVTISATDTTYTAGTGINIDANNVISATATPGQTYTAGNGININQSNEISVDTSVVATQTNLNNKVSKGTNQINGQLFSIEDTYGNSANFGPDYVRIDFDDGTDSGSAGLQRDSLGAIANNKISKLTSDSLALKDDLNLTQTTYAEDEITVVDNGYGTSETYQFSGGGNNQIARLKDVKTYTAGNGINISQNNEISADTSVVATKTDLNTKQDTLTAGENTSIENICESDMQGPCPSGFHVPTVGEWNGLINIMKNALSLQYGHQWMQYLHMPYAGQRDCESSNVDRQRIEGFYATSIFDDATPSFSMAFFLLVRAGDTVYVEEYGLPVAMGFSIRGFKNEYIMPTSSWTVVQGTLGSAGIFRDQTNGLISITDGTTGYTIMDKNLGATTVFNNGDTLSEANCGKYYQWGNNYGFPRSGSITTSSTQVDASGYGPGNYYSSSTFITTSTSPFDWSSVENKNLRGGVSQGTWCRLTISAEDTKYTAGNGINIDANNEISNTLPGPTIAAAAPSNPTEGQLWYDTTNDVLKVYDGTNWNVVGDDAADINTKTFYLSSSSDLTTAQAGLDWYLAGKNPIFVLANSGRVLTVYDVTSTKMRIIGNIFSSTATTSYTNLGLSGYAYTISNGTIVSSESTTVGNHSVLDPTHNYSTPYTPLSNGSPATKKYVDDNIKTYTAGTGVSIDANNQISNTLPGPTIAATAPTGTEGALWYDTTNDVLMAHDGTAWKEAGTQMKVLSYGHSTWQDFIDAYNENAIVYCRASSNSNPGSGNQGRMAFMAFVSINNTTGLPTDVEFQYYRSRSDHNTAANQLDQVFVYKLTSASGGTWTVTERNTGAKAVAGTGINLAFGSGNMTISADTTTLATKTDLNSKQDTLVSGTNIKTVNNESLLGTGNITISTGSEIVYCTQDEYNALPSTKLSDNKNYIIIECS